MKKTKCFLFLILAITLLLAACSDSETSAVSEGSKEAEIQASTYICPVAGASYVNSWGDGRSGGRVHKGADLGPSRGIGAKNDALNRGTRLLAVTNGKIEYMRTNAKGDNRIKLAGADGKWYYYGHLDKFVKGMVVGQSITKGQVIGYMGSENQGPRAVHLHFEIHPTRESDDNEIDPHPFLDIWCKGSPAPTPPAPPLPTPTPTTDDIVWQRNDGQVHYWAMKNGKRVDYSNIYTPIDSSWRVVGVGDVTGDATDDIVWQRNNGQVHYWSMKSGKRIGSGNIHTPVDSSWRVVGVGDVNGDGTDDIVWRNILSGKVTYWSMRNGVRTGGSTIYTLADLTWTPQDVGDVNGDGTDDIVWRNNRGQVHYWAMKSGKRIGWANIHTPVDNTWSIQGVGDVNGDRTDDIIWRRRTDGQVHYWAMRSGKRISGTNIHTPIDSSWRIVGAGNVDR